MVKGDKFNIDKGIRKVLVGLGWNPSKGQSADLDASAFGCILVNGQPKFYNDGSHAVVYANDSLKKGPGKRFGTEDGSIYSSGDDRTGAGSNSDDETINIDFDLLPVEIEEIGIFVTLYDARKKNQTFSDIDSCYVRVIDADANNELCKYDVTHEFNGGIAGQIGSFTKDGNKWKFTALGASMHDKDLNDIIGVLS